MRINFAPYTWGHNSNMEFGSPTVDIYLSDGAHMGILSHTKEHPFIPYSRETVSEEEGIAKGAVFDSLNARRSVRFSDQSVPKAMIEHAIAVRPQHPGAHRQPWRLLPSALENQA